LYSGICRIGSHGVVEESKMSILFDGDRFQVTGSKGCAPPGEGTYEIDEFGQIRFTDRTFHTAEFDWSLILDGSFDYEHGNGTLIIAREEPGKHRVRTMILNRSRGVRYGHP
jgi:hypothetical protein